MSIFNEARPHRITKVRGKAIGADALHHSSYKDIKVKENRSIVWACRHYSDKPPLVIYRRAEEVISERAEDILADYLNIIGEQNYALRLRKAKDGIDTIAAKSTDMPFRPGVVTQVDLKGYERQVPGLLGLLRDIEKQLVGNPFGLLAPQVEQAIKAIRDTWKISLEEGAKLEAEMYGKDHQRYQKELGDTAGKRVRKSAVVRSF